MNKNPFSDWLNSDDGPFDGHDTKYADLVPTIHVAGGVVMINPGTGPVTGATEANAFENMRQLLKDSDVAGLEFRRVADKDYGNGRYAFEVRSPQHKHVFEIQMPGWALENVRFMGEDGQNVFEFPRLYKDGNSWLWMYAIPNRERFEAADEYDAEVAP